MLPQYEGSALLAMPRVSPRIHAIPPAKTSIIRFVDAVDTAVSLTDRDGRLTSMNAPARDFFVGARARASAASSRTRCASR